MDSRFTSQAPDRGGWPPTTSPDPAGRRTDDTDAEPELDLLALGCERLGDECSALPAPTGVAAPASPSAVRGRLRQLPEHDAVRRNVPDAEAERDLTSGSGVGGSTYV